MSENPAMYVPVAGAFVGAVEGVLHAINVEEDTIREIVAILDANSQALGASLPGTIKGTAYGGSWSGETLGHHTRLAHDHVERAMREMMETLAGTGDRVRAYHDELTFVDDDAEARKRVEVGRLGAIPTRIHGPAGGSPGASPLPGEDPVGG